MDELLQRAIALATAAHTGQFDKAGQPYIGHPLRAMAHFQDVEAKIVAVLHDVVEDTDVGLADLEAAGFPAVVVAAVDALSKREGEEKDIYLRRVCADRLALRVKIADMLDNLNVFRIPDPGARDLERIRRYCAIYPQLIEALVQGSPTAASLPEAPVPPPEPDR